jgi:hypothetical protein
MRVIRQARDLGAERTLALAASIADDFWRAGWALADYRWLEFELEEGAVLELAFDSMVPGAVAPPDRAGSGLELEHPGDVAFFWTVVVPFALLAAFIAVMFLLARH